MGSKKIRWNPVGFHLNSQKNILAEMDAKKVAKLHHDILHFDDQQAFKINLILILLKIDLSDHA
jgi:hypothetical protein